MISGRRYYGRSDFSQKSNLHLFTLLFGAGIIIPSIAARISGAEAENGLSLFIYVGLAFLILSLILSQFNRKAYLKICDGRIEGRFHYFGRINTPVSDIRFSYAQLNRLTLLLENGKRLAIMGISNSSFICNAIMQSIGHFTDEPPEKCKDRLMYLRAARKKHLIKCGTATAIMFINIFIAAILTGGRDFDEFGKLDILVMFVMGLAEAVTIFFASYHAQKSGKLILNIQNADYDLRRAVIKASPLLPGDPIAVYADAEFTSRITLFGYPDCTSVYFSEESFTPDRTLKKKYMSEIYEDTDPELSLLFDELIDISDIFGIKKA